MNLEAKNELNKIADLGKLCFLHKYGTRASGLCCETVLHADHCSLPPFPVMPLGQLPRL